MVSFGLFFDTRITPEVEASCHRLSSRLRGLEGGLEGLDGSPSKPVTSSCPLLPSSPKRQELRSWPA